MQLVTRFYIAFLLLCCIQNTYAQTAKEIVHKAADKSRKRDFKGALELYNKAIELSPDTADYYIYRSYCYSNMGDKDAAEKNAQDILTRFDDWNAYLIVADYYQDYKEFDKQVETVELAVEKFTDSVHDTIKIKLRNALGWSRYNVRDYYGAKDDYLYSYSLDTANMNTWYYLATIYDEVGKTDSSIYFYNRLLEKNKDYLGYYISLGFLYNNIGRYNDAMALYKKAFAIVDKRKDNVSRSSMGLLYSNRGYANFKLGKYKAALKDFEKSIEFYPTNSYVYKNRALVYIQQNKINEACTDLHHAISLGFSDQYGKEVENMTTTYCH